MTSFSEIYFVDYFNWQINHQKTKVMQNKILIRLSLLSLIAVTLTSCDLVEGIFKAGMGVGIFIVIAVIAVIVFVISKLGGSK